MKTTLMLKVDEIQVTTGFAKLHGWASFPEGGSAYMILAMPTNAVLPKAGANVTITVTVDRRVKADPNYAGFERRFDNTFLTGVDQAVEKVLSNHGSGELGVAE